MPVRTAKAVWDGTLKEGHGHIAFAAFDQPYTWRSRFADEAGTNPEELIGGALAGCFSMALSGDLVKAGHPPKHIATSAAVTIEPKDGGGFSITGIALTTEAEIPGIDGAEFERIAEGTRQNCPVARALKVPISVSARLK